MDPWSGVDGGMPVGAVVPAGFEAYARMFPAAYSLPNSERSTWSEVAASTGRVAHPLMEWHLISTPAPGSGLPAWSWLAGETLPRVPSGEEFRDYVGGSADCIERLNASRRLEVLPVSVNDRVDINADVINGN